MSRRFLALVLLAGLAGLGADGVDLRTQFPDPVGAGELLTIKGTFANSKPSNVLIIPIAKTEPAKRAPVTPSKDNDAVTFTLPLDLTAGRYYVQLDYDDKDRPKELVPGAIRVVANPITLDSASPTTAYRNPITGLFDFNVVGQNFSPDLTSNQVYVTGQGGIIKSWHNTEQECKGEKEQPCLWADKKEVQEKLHVMGYKAERYQGPLALNVGVGGVRSTEKNLILSRRSETEVLIWSVIIFGVLAYIIYRLVAQGVRDYMIGGTHYSPLLAFLIDKQSNTYSLSKFQLFLFSIVFVFGYLYVFLCRWLVQWQFILPDVPSNLAGLLGISAGTTIVAAGATVARGSKGAGKLLPSAADLISTGGMVVPERFQFFVWTLVACFGFVVLLISQNPATITGFPTFPDGLLYVMGVSSAGYLGGKLVRKPGPVIRSVAWDSTRSQLIIQGENLSSEGDFFIDEHKLPIVIPPPTSPPTSPPSSPPSSPPATAAALAAQESRKLVTSKPQDQGSDTTFCSELKIEIVVAQSGVDLSTGEHVFRIVNKDGQFADVRFTVDPPVIKSVTMAEDGTPNAADENVKRIKSGKSAVTVLVSGSGFRSNMTARWTPVGAQDPVELTPAAFTNVTQKSLKLTLVPGDAGPAVLLLLTPSGFSVTTTVTVV